jgi:UDP-N-acetylmuramate dehydrogenase
VYGNAGAYGNSIAERVVRVRAFDGTSVRELSRGECQFRYRESVFKEDKNLLILAVELEFGTGDPAALLDAATKIRTIRDAKYPPTMRCAGSIFKNCLFAELPAPVQAQVPPELVREGKVPSAWFLEAAGAKGIRVGDIQVAEYHANLIYNDGGGTAADLRMVISDLKQSVRRRYVFDLQEEVQYLGF